MLVNISVPVKTIEEVTITATRVDIGVFALDYENQRFAFALDFGVMDNSTFVSKREALLTISGGPVYSQLLAFTAPGTASLFVTEIPDLIQELITTLDQNPSLVDGVNVVLDFSPINFTEV